MPQLTVNGISIEVEKGERLVLAIQRAGVAIGHRCGGLGECTACHVQFIKGEPEVMTEAEYNELISAHLVGKERLACQIEVDQDMEIKVMDTIKDHPEWKGDPGMEPSELVEPEAVWYPIEDLKSWN